MRTAFFLVLALTVVTSADTSILDSLVTKSYKMRVEASKGPGYVKFQGVLVKPERMSPRFERATELVGHALHTFHLTPPDSLFGASSNASRLATLEAAVETDRVERAKMLTVLENLQAQSESSIKSTDEIVKLVQAAAGLLTAIAGLIGGLIALMKFLKRGKKSKPS